MTGAYPEDLQILITDIGNKCQSINKAHKAHLESARQLFFYFEALTTTPDKALIRTLITAIHDCSNQDGERKIFRVYFLLLKEIFISSYARLQSEHEAYIEQLTLETYSTNVFRQSLAWKTIGIMLQHKIFEKHLSVADVQDALCKLSYPIPAKKSIFGAADDTEYHLGLHLWACIMSAIAHTNSIVPEKCLKNILLGIKSSHHRLARNSLQALILAIPSNPIEALKGIHALVCSKAPDPYAKLKSDQLFMVYLCRAISTLAVFLPSYLQQDDAHFTEIFVRICDILQSKNK